MPFVLCCAARFVRQHSLFCFVLAAVSPAISATAAVLLGTGQLHCDLAMITPQFAEKHSLTTRSAVKLEQFSESLVKFMLIKAHEVQANVHKIMDHL